MNKCPYVLKRFHALKKELQIFLLTIFQVPGMDLPEARDVQNTKDFVLIPGRVGDILCLYTLKDRLSRILQILFSFFFLSRK